MAVCSVCGKKGIFLKVNYYGRCKNCQEKYEKTENERIRIEDEERAIKIRAQEENMRKQLEAESAKREEAKTLLLRIIKTYKEVDRKIFTLKEDEDCEEFIPEIECYIKKCNEFNDLIEKADNTEMFQSVLIDYIDRKFDFGEEDSPYIHVVLSNEYFNIKNIDFFQDKILQTLTMNLRSLGYKQKNEWQHTKESIEKAVKKKKEREEKNKNVSVPNKKPDEKSHEQCKTIKYNRPIQDKLFDTLPDCVITDIETSGLIYNKNSIIEIAAIKIVDCKIAGIYSTLIHRDKPLSSEVTSLTGITTKMLQDCKTSLDKAISEYRDFIGDLPLVGHNIKSFDIKFINQAYTKVFGSDINNECIDTLKMSYEYFIEAKSHKLTDLAEYAGTYTGDTHRALGDCETTLSLYKCMIDIASATLLKWSESGKPIDRTDMIYPKYIRKKYPIERCSVYHEKLISSGYLKKAGAEIVLKKLKVAQLKKILADHSLPPGGNKPELILRIMKNIDLSFLDIPDVYVPSQKGISNIDNFGDAVNIMAYRYLGIDYPANKD